eukprot:TRINITY_DN53535_c0_g1_i1.p1 TRINITY_DN53535_c0_g1~~TRINITY_DN53535_c0_g1_i1.p1  ORF type:complete len:234 (+),score=40.71 TRINITY_DN53535_c0_g1_i1:77-778(+)
MPFFLVAYLQNVAYTVAIGGIADSICQSIEIHFSKRRHKKWYRSQLEDGKEPVAISPPPTPPFELPDNFPQLEIQKFSPQRALQFAGSFGLFGATSSFIWYEYLLPLFTGEDFWSNMLIDNLIYNPYFMLQGLAVNAFYKRQDKAYVWKKVKQDFWLTYLVGEAVILPADVIMFTQIPVEFRVAYIKTVNVVWMVGASYLANRDIKMKKPKLNKKGQAIEPGMECYEDTDDED